MLVPVWLVLNWLAPNVLVPVVKGLNAAVVVVFWLNPGNGWVPVGTVRLANPENAWVCRSLGPAVRGPPYAS